MVLNMVILGLLQIATIYSHTFQQFLAVRSLFGLFMGGVYGNAIAMALEHCPVNARGLMSGILQQGYSFGYVLAACANLGVGGETESWKVSDCTLFAIYLTLIVVHRLFSGQELESPSVLVLFESASLKVSNSSKPRKLATKILAPVTFGVRRK